MVTKKLIVGTVSACVLAISVSACGGGSAGDAPIAAPSAVVLPSSPPPTSGNPAFNTQEYQGSQGAAQADAIRAYESGVTGKNVTVALIDSSFVFPNAPQFAGRIHPASTDMVASRGLYGGDGHGAEVASLIGAAKDNVGMHGVAFDSTLLMLRTDLPNTCNPLCAASVPDIPKAIDIAIQNGAHVINLSMTFAAPQPLGFASAIDRATAAGSIVVIAAGNQGQAEAFQSSLLALQPEARGMVIVAGATNNAGTDLASFSNRAGGSANFYVAAVGTNLQVMDKDGNVVVRSGTSLATPVVAGAVALLIEAYPNLTGQQIVNLLLTSATDMGAPGTDAIYGRGKLNLTAAFAQAQVGVSVSN
jgi:subtilisin family serine protease